MVTCHERFLEQIVQLAALNKHEHQRVSGNLHLGPFSVRWVHGVLGCNKSTCRRTAQVYNVDPEDVGCSFGAYSCGFVSSRALTEIHC